MNVKELVDEVSRRADTAGTAITRPECGRVVAILFDVLAEQSALEALALVLAEFRRRLKRWGQAQGGDR